MRNAALFGLGIVIISFTLSITAVRLCASSSQQMARLSIAYLICGRDLNEGKSGFVRLSPAEIFAISNIPESKEFSIDRGFEAAKLVDGSRQTLAEPATGNAIDYTIGFFSPYEVKGVTIYWGGYGLADNYVNSWTLESSMDGKSWKPLTRGGSPHDAQTVVSDRFEALQLRLRAQAAKDWIGAYEVEIVGRPL